jgi:two-component system nitrate/nitrite response regulator NarL
VLRVFIVDDHPLIRQGVEQLLAARGHSVVGVASRGAGACAAIREASAHVVVIDLGLPELSGVELIRLIRDEELPVGIVVYTAVAHGPRLAEAVRAGANGLVTKDAPVAHLAEAVERVHRGESFIDPQLRGVLDSAGPLLSDREREVLQHAAQGYKLGDIAEELFISPETARTHLRNARTKLGARTVAEAVSEAIASGQIEGSGGS